MALQDNEVSSTTAVTSWRQHLLKNVEAQLEKQTDVTVRLKVDVLLMEIRVRTSLSSRDMQDVETTLQRWKDIEEELTVEMQREAELKQQRQQLQQLLQQYQ